MYDRSASFAAYFKRVEDGYIFYPHRFARGISVTEAERERMLEAYEDLYDGKALAAFLLIAIAAGLIAVFGSMALFWGGNPTLAVVLLGVIFSAILVLTWLRGRSIREPIRGRKADQPRRDSREFDVALGRSWGGLGYLFLLVFGLQIQLSASQLMQSFSWKYAAIFAFFLFAFLFFARILLRTFLANRADKG